ncbi:MAG: trypsin-like peptidase domain-containing protein [Candidatus Omnitrophica bacterium]|nr:trypsin-like peptidase domain-containing protein [Candidatus Omnitrophota bacterium]
MKKIIVMLWVLASIIVYVPSAGWAADFRDSVVKVFTTANPLDYVRPWQSKGIESKSGSGCIIKGNRILTNAHVISDQTFIQVKKYNSPKKYTARLFAVAHQCDLAILEVDNPEFFKDTLPLELGGLPSLQDTVHVIGFPEGGDKVSITQGVVSRIEMTQYSHSLMTLLAVQIDAAINPGNSGGPVIKDDKLIGIAMQGMQNAQNIGYIIPVPVIQHFLKDVNDGQLDGFPQLGIQFADTESRSLRKYYKVSENQGGALVVNVLPFSPSEGKLYPDDVVLSIDGVDIGEDGTYAFRQDERLYLSEIVLEKMIGDTVKVRVLRNGKEQIIPIKLTSFRPLVPYPFAYGKAQYYIFGGLAFTVLTTDLLMNWNNPYQAPENFIYYFLGKGSLNKERKKERVVLLGVLPDDVNIGYHTDHMEVIEKVNGHDFSSFEEFVKLVNKKEGPFTVFETDGEYKMILDNNGIDKANEEILKRNSVPAAYSEEVAKWMK